MSDMKEAPVADPVAEGADSEISKESEIVETDKFKLLSDVPVRFSVEVGSVSKRLADIVSFQQDQVVELDRQADELLDVMVNGTLIAKGEVVTVDGRFGIKIVELASSSVSFPDIERR